MTPSRGRVPRCFPPAAISRSLPEEGLFRVRFDASENLARAAIFCRSSTEISSGVIIRMESIAHSPFFRTSAMKSKPLIPGIAMSTTD